MTREPPMWASPHEVVFETPLARLRDFSTLRKSSLVPTLVLPPQAGHDSCIVDYSAEQGQIQTILASGLERALALGSAQPKRPRTRRSRITWRSFSRRSRTAVGA